MRSRKEKNLLFDIQENIDEKSIIAELSNLYRVVKVSSKTIRQIYLDTFDWRLYNKNLILIKEPELFKLKNIYTHKYLSSLSSDLNNNPKFWWDFNDSLLKEELKKIIDLRALIQIISVRKTIQSYKLLNKDEKTVVIIYFEKIKPHRRNSALHSTNLLICKPLRGYENDLKQIKKPIVDLGLKLSETSYYELLLNKSAIVPADYSSKLNISLNADMSTRDALLTILTSLLRTIKKNEDGIKKDIDTEFLHDFRVAVRRTRSALSLIKGVFDKEQLRIHRTNITKLGKATNALRDLDVYLLKENQYKKLIPRTQHKGLELIFDKFKEQRKIELAKLKRFLNSKHYKKIISDWEDFLNNGGQISDETENAGTNVLSTAKRIINKKHKEILKAGAIINDNSPDEQLHSLRIECKKLRYMIEFFSSLFPENEIDQFIKQLKKLQDNLGDFNDLYVQQQSLKEYSEKFDSHSKEITISIGGLIAVLYRKQIETKKQFNSSFELFASKENTSLFNKIFRSKKS
ncbi:MAG: CHAD domain-containing protein [Candidatus Dadabacteria bacterium]|nr:CHAD domain-containing protein [Candidatus Dadabacteria bacterium]